jgi:hypothetical protein
MKQWACPGCAAALHVGTLRAATIKAEGQWAISGVCPGCRYGVRISKGRIVMTARSVDRLIARGRRRRGAA